MRAEARACARVHGETMAAEELLRMATLGGAQALGLDGEVGSLAPGKRADLVALRPAAPVRDPAAAALAAAHGVDLVVASGEVVVERRPRPRRGRRWHRCPGCARLASGSGSVASRAPRPEAHPPDGAGRRDPHLAGVRGGDLRRPRPDLLRRRRRVGGGPDPRRRHARASRASRATPRRTRSWRPPTPRRRTTPRRSRPPRGRRPRARRPRAGSGARLAAAPGGPRRRRGRVASGLHRPEPRDAEAFLQLGQQAEQAGRTQLAQLAYQTFLRLEPDDRNAEAVRERLNELSGARHHDGGG